MRSIKKRLLITLTSLIIISSFGITKVTAADDKSVVGQIENLKCTLSFIVTKVGTVANDILKLKNTVSAQQSDITNMKNTITKQEEEIKILTSEINTLKSQSGISKELVTVKIASFTAKFAEVPGSQTTYNLGSSFMANKKLLITNMVDPQKTYTCTLDGNGKGNIALPAGSYIFDFGPNNMSLFVVTENINNPKIAVLHYKSEEKGDILSIKSNLVQSYMSYDTTDPISLGLFSQF